MNINELPKVAQFQIARYNAALDILAGIGVGIADIDTNSEWADLYRRTTDGRLRQALVDVKVWGKRANRSLRLVNKGVLTATGSQDPMGPTTTMPVKLNTGAGPGIGIALAAAAALLLARR